MSFANFDPLQIRTEEDVSRFIQWLMPEVTSVIGLCENFLVIESLLKTQEALEKAIRSENPQESVRQALQEFIKEGRQAVKKTDSWKEQQVKELRALPYKDYLRTGHWEELRGRALDKAKNKCQLCNSPKHLQVHHRTYKRIGRERLSDVIVLCKYCHAKFHDKLP